MAVVVVLIYLLEYYFGTSLIAILSKFKYDISNLYITASCLSV